MLTFYILLLLLNLTAVFANDSTTDSPKDPEAQVKCDACVLISQKFADAFHSAEEKEKTLRLSERQITETAEGVCDELMRGYGTVQLNGIDRLAGPLTGRDLTVSPDEENIWSHRLQDFCDEVMAELSNEKAMYDAWATNPDTLEHMLCRGKDTFSACVSENFGNWPGDDDYDYDDGDMDYIHDEF